MAERINRNEMLMQVATIVARRSTCLRLQVGAVLAKEGRILSIGYAGAPSGLPHCSPETCTPDKPCERTIHAEANAIAFAAKEGISTDESSLYVTHSPCMSCAKLLINAGVKMVLYSIPYRDSTPIDYLAHAGLIVGHYAPQS